MYHRKIGRWIDMCARVDVCADILIEIHIYIYT